MAAARSGVKQAAVQIAHFAYGPQAGAVAGVVVHDLDLFGQGIPLDVDGFAGLAAGIVRCRGVPEPVVGAEGHRRPGGMAHPEQQAAAFAAAALEQRPVGIVVDPLRPGGEGLAVGRGPEVRIDGIDKRLSSLRALQREIVDAPHPRRRPGFRRPHHPYETLPVGEVRHAALAVELGRFLGIPGMLVQLEILLRRQPEVGAAAGDDVVGRGGDVDALRIFAGHEGAQRLVERGRRIAFVAAAPEQDARMFPHTEDHILRIFHKEFLVVGIRPVGRVRQPEVLPDEDAVAVGGLVEFFVADHAYPVADEVKVLVAMELHSGLIISGMESEITLAESPVSAAAHEAAAVDPDAEITSSGAVGKLPDARLERYAVAVADTHLHFIEIRRSVAVRPPEFGIIQQHLRGDGKPAAGRHGDRHAERNIAVVAFPHSLDRMVCIVGKQRLQRDHNLRRVEFRRQGFQR